MARRQKDSGFTLLEVMVALAIVGIALVVMLGLVQRSILVNSRLQQMTRATLLAKQKMSEVETGVHLLDEQQQGEFAEPNQNYSWRADYTPTPLTGIEQVDISVIWGREENNELVTLTSFVKE
jgi:general secretion pathway protein I